MKIRYLPKSYNMYSYDDTTHITKLSYNGIEFNVDVLCCLYFKYFALNNFCDEYFDKLFCIVVILYYREK
jgi:hypothetical protein